MIVLGHRGVTDGSVAENTIDAFAAARDRGANGIETDLQLTKDKKLILFHNHYKYH
jgi:glycerophosphoryl diester phosphodiesterase